MNPILYTIDQVGPPVPVPSNGIELGVFCAGPENGTPVVLCHGFPELAFTWRHQVNALAEAGYRVFAPDMRGFGHSSAPAAIEDYDMEQLCADMVGLLDFFSIPQAVFIGHDWGGVVVWEMPLRHPSRVLGVIGLNTPFVPRHAQASALEAYRHKYGDDMYIIQFQKPGVAEKVLEKNPLRTLQFFMRRARVTLAEFEAAPKEARSLNFLQSIENGNLEQWMEHSALSPEDLNVFVRVYAHTGFRGGVNWYRNFERNWENSAELPQRIDQPCLMIMAENDVVLPPSLADGMENFVPNLDRYLVKDCGHWTQQEKPAEVSRVLVDWLAVNFPAR